MNILSITLQIKKTQISLGNGAEAILKRNRFRFHIRICPVQMNHLVNDFQKQINRPFVISVPLKTGSTRSIFAGQSCIYQEMIGLCLRYQH